MKYMLLLLFYLTCQVSIAQVIPATKAQSFADTNVNLPSDLRGKTGVFVLGFSRASSAQTKVWGESLLREYGTDPHILYFQMPVLADAPSFIRGLILQGIRKQASEANKPHFLPILQDSAAWKSAVQFASADEAYILVLDSTGQIKWRAHGGFATEALAQLKNCVSEIQASPLSSCK